MMTVRVMDHRRGGFMLVILIAQLIMNKTRQTPQDMIKCDRFYHHQIKPILLTIDISIAFVKLLVGRVGLH